MSYESHKQKLAANPAEAARELESIRQALDRSAIVAITDQAGRIIHVNDKFVEISKYPREELINQNHRLINSGFHDSEFFRRMWRTISSGQTWEGEIRNRAKDGSIYWVHTTIVPFLNEGGKPYQYVSIRYEITQRKVAEEQLRVAAELAKEREDNFRLLLDSIFEGVVLHTSEGEIVGANLAAARIFGGERDQLVGAAVARFWDAPEAASGEHEGQSVSGRRLDGSEVYLEVSSKPFNYLGRALCLTAIHDVTQRKALEAQVLMQDRLASVGLLASSLAHEIGNPLGIIRGRAEFMALQEDASETLRRSAEVIMAQIDRMSKLVRSLLNLSRGESRQAAGRVPLLEIFAEAGDLMRGELKKARIELVVKEAKGPPPVVKAESGPLHQILLNLLVNAIHAIETGRRQGLPSGLITLEVEEAGQNWIIAVRDNGCGISKKNMGQLFKPFFTTKEVGVGTGLGLATTYRIVEGWGGSISVESTEGAGASFRVALPKA